MHEAIHLLDFLFGVCILFGIWHLGFRPFLLDQFRSKIFNIRDELFDLAAAGQIEFSSASYEAVRDWTNMVLRFAHRLSVIDMMILSSFMPKLLKDAEKSSASYRKAIQSEEDHVIRGKLFDLKTEIDRLVARYFVMANPLMWMIFPVALTYVSVRDVSRNVVVGNEVNRVLKWVTGKIEPQFEKERYEQVASRCGELTLTL